MGAREAVELPDEVLRIIFAMFTDSLPDDTEILAISRVCASWRQAALGQSYIWRTIDILWREEKYHTWVRRAGIQPLIIQCILRVSQRWWDQRSRRPLHHLRDLIQVRRRELARASSLVIIAPGTHSIPIVPYEMDDIYEWLLEPASSLHHFEFSFFDNEAVGALKLRSSIIPQSVRAVRLYNLFLKNPTFPHLTTLDLNYVSCSIEEWAMLFRSAERLETLRLSYVGLAGHGGTPLTDDRPPATLGDLKNLHLTDAAPSILTTLLRCCTIPSLDRLELIQDELLVDAGFLIRFFNGIQSLTCDLFTENMPEVFRAISTLSRLQDLELHWGHDQMQNWLRGYITYRIAMPDNPVHGGKALQCLRLKDYPDEDTDWLAERVQKLELL